MVAMDLDHSSHAQTQNISAQQVTNDTMTTLQDDVTQSNEMLHLPVLHGGVTEVFLFPFFSTSDDASFALVCLVLVLVAIGLELMKLALWRMEEAYISEVGSTGAAFTCRFKHCAATQTLISSSEITTYDAIPSLKQQQQQQQQQQQEDQCTGSHKAESKQPSRLKRWVRLAGVGFMQSQVYQVGTLLMLVAMTMNIYAILALSAGSGVGKMVTLHLKERYKERSKGDNKQQHQQLASSSSSSCTCSSSSSSTCCCCSCSSHGK